MDATEARVRTQGLIRERELAEQRAAQEAKLAHERSLEERAADMRREVDILIDEAIAREDFETTFSWESVVSDDPETSQQEFNEGEDHHAAFVMMGEGLAADGFNVSYGTENLNAFNDDATGTHDRYTIFIDWLPRSKKRNIFVRMGNRAAKAWRDFNDIESWL